MWRYPVWYELQTKTFELGNNISSSPVKPFCKPSIWLGISLQIVGGRSWFFSPCSDENAYVPFAEHVLEAAAMDNYVPCKRIFSLQHFPSFQISFELMREKFDELAYNLSDTSEWHIWWTHIICVTQKEWRKLWKGLFLKIVHIFNKFFSVGKCLTCNFLGHGAESVSRLPDVSPTPPPWAKALSSTAYLFLFTQPTSPNS